MLTMNNPWNIVERHFRSSDNTSIVEYRNNTPKQTVVEWRIFLVGSPNKSILIQFLPHQWRQDERRQLLGNKIIYVTYGTRCYEITTNGCNLCLNLESGQEDADTHLLLHGPLTRYVKLRVAHAREFRERFPSPPISKETASQRSRHASRHVRLARAVMYVGIAYPHWGENVPGIPGACATRNFTYLVRGPCNPCWRTRFSICYNRFWWHWCISHISCMQWQDNISADCESGTDARVKYVSASSIALALGRDTCGAMLGFICLTGCDTTSSFAGRGKLHGMKLLIESLEHITMFQNVGK